MVTLMRYMMLMYSRETPEGRRWALRRNKRTVGGFYILDCKDLEEAVEWAKRIPTSCKGLSGSIEIRPIADLPPPPEA